MVVVASLTALEPAIVAGIFATFNTVLMLWWSRRMAREEERRDEERARQVAESPDKT